MKVLNKKFLDSKVQLYVGEGGRHHTPLIQRIVPDRSKIFPLTNIVIGEAKIETQR